MVEMKEKTERVRRRVTFWTCKTKGRETEVIEGREEQMPRTGLEKEETVRAEERTRTKKERSCLAEMKRGKGVRTSGRRR